MLFFKSRGKWSVVTKELFPHPANILNHPLCLMSGKRITRFFLIRIVYKNNKAQVCRKMKNILRTNANEITYLSS